MLFPFIAAALIYAVFPTPAHPGDVTLQWNSVAGADGYNIYYGTKSRDYHVTIDTGNETNVMLSLAPGTYYFSVKAYNNYGESDYSGEISEEIPDRNSPAYVSLTSDLPSPQPEGTMVIFTAEVIGGSGSYEYTFWEHSSVYNIWNVAQDYSSSGNYTYHVRADILGIVVWAKNAGTTGI